MIGTAYGLTHLVFGALCGIDGSMDVFRVRAFGNWNARIGELHSLARRLAKLRQCDR